MTGARFLKLFVILTPCMRAADPTYVHDVAPILNQHCVVCHRANDIGPMALGTYRETRPWAAAIREAVATHKMPPWHGDPGSHAFSNDSRLADSDIATLVSWASTGAKEGDVPSSMASVSFPSGWHIQPDVIFSLPREQLVAAGRGRRL